MPTTTIGTNAELVDQRQVFDPNRGTEIQQEWKGTEAQLASLASGYAAAGIRSELSNRGGVPTLLVYLIGNEDGGGGDEVPTDRFDLGKEYVLKPVWDHPWVFSIASEYMQANTGTFRTTFGLTQIDEMVALFRQMITNWLQGKAQTGGFGADEPYVDAEKGSPLLPLAAGAYVGLGVDADLIQLYAACIRAGTDLEQERPTLTRVRTFSAAYASRMVLDPISKVWETNALVSEFAIPAVIAAQLPADPGAAFTPENTVWSWKLTDDQSTVNYNGKLEERKTWAFANWTRTFHEVV